MIRKLIAQPVTVRITQISSVVALAPIEGDTGRSHQFVTPISGDVIQFRETSLLLIAYIYKIGEQPSLGIVERAHHLQLSDRLQRSVAVSVFDDFLNLLCRKEWKLLQRFTR